MTSDCSLIERVAMSRSVVWIARRIIGVNLSASFGVNFLPARTPTSERMKRVKLSVGLRSALLM